MSTTTKKDDIVSEFIEGTCRPDPRPNVNKAMAWRRSGQNYDDEIWTTAGSLSELYIEPMLLCIEDIDTMLHKNHNLAVSSRRKMPLYLPKTFKNTVQVYKMVKSQFRNYVYLRAVGQLKKQQQGEDYVFIPEEQEEQVDRYLSESSMRQHLARRMALSWPCNEQSNVYQITTQDIGNRPSRFSSLPFVAETSR